MRGRPEGSPSGLPEGTGKHAKCELLLCQPDKRKGGAWCCGLYNVRDSGREELITRLRRRTKAFSRTPRTTEAIVRYSEQTNGEERLRLLDPDFCSCEFVGFLDANETRVGCLLNPMSRGNGGVDWRGLSFHGGSACSGFFCRAFRELTGVERAIVLAAIDDWYLYGLILSDVDYIRAVLRLLELALGRSLTLEQGLSPPVLEAIHRLFRWKIDRRFSHGRGLPNQPPI